MKIKDVNVYGLEESIVASRFPMDSGDVFDNFKKKVWELKSVRDKRPELFEQYVKDLTATKLANAKAGSGHDCWLKGVIVHVNLFAPAYFTLQEYRYHFRDTISSQSKMHKIKELLKNQDFPADVYRRVEWAICEYFDGRFDIDHLMNYIPMSWHLGYREHFTYLQLKTMYSQRETHKTMTWKEFCNWIKTLPCSFLITGEYDG